MIKKHFWTVLPASLVLHLKELRLSPLGIVPQHKQQLRIICNCTFFGINQDTTPKAPQEAMKFRKTLPRLLQTLAFSNPKYGPFCVAKYDTSDGFCRLQLSCNSILPLGLLLPTSPGEAPPVTLPLVVTMGWTKAPPSFCSTTETVTNLANWSLAMGRHLSLTDWSNVLIPLLQKK